MRAFLAKGIAATPIGRQAMAEGLHDLDPEQRAELALQLMRFVTRRSCASRLSSMRYVGIGLPSAGER